MILATAATLAVLGGCSRGDDQAAGAASATAAGQQEAAPVAGGPTTLKPGSWKTVTKTPAGDETSLECVGEGYDPGAEAARKATPCGQPTLTRTTDGFRLAQVCEKGGVKYDLTGVVRGDFTTRAESDLTLVLSAFGRRQTLHMQALSTYQGACEPGAAKPAS